MKHIFLKLLITTFFSLSLLKAVPPMANEDQHLFVMNYSITQGAKNAALAEYPFIPDDEIGFAKTAILTAFPADVTAADLVHKSELPNREAILVQTAKVAEKHKPLLEEAERFKQANKKTDQ